MDTLTSMATVIVTMSERLSYLRPART